MLRSSAALPPYAVEVPITNKVDGSLIPTLDIEAACGPTKFNFPLGNAVGCSLGSNVYNPIAVSASQDDSRALIWELDADSPSVLVLRHFSVTADGSHEDDTVHLRFTAPILPSITSCQINQGSKIFCLTEDGGLHAITYLKERSGTDTLLQSLSPLAEAVLSIPLGDYFDRLGEPTSLTRVEDTVCIGTSQGNVLCVAATNPSVDTIFELNLNAGLLGSLSGFFVRGVPQDVQQLVELKFMERSFLCSIHTGAVMKLWDLSTRRLVHSCDLLPPEEAAAHTATVARVAVEPLDATCSILLVFFEPLDDSSSGMLCTFLLFLEDRGGSLKVVMEGGPRLAGGVHRLVDLAVQHLGPQTLGAWMLFADAMAVEVFLVEDQVEGFVPSPTATAQIATLRRLVSALESAIPEDLCAGFTPTQVFLDAIFVPGHLCRAALYQTVLDLGWSTALADDVKHADVASLRSSFLAAVKAAAESDQDGDFGVWITLINVYTEAVRAEYAPLALVQISTNRDSEQGLLLVRSGGSLSVIRGAEASEIVAAGGPAKISWPPAWNSIRPHEATAVKSVLHASSIIVNACGGKHGLSMIHACVLQGADLHAHVLPAVLKWLLSGEGPEEWRAACRSLPVNLGRLCSVPVDGFAAAVDVLVDLLSQSIITPGRFHRSKLESIAPPVIAAALVQAHQCAHAQSDCLLGLALLTSYLTSQHALGTWTLPDSDRNQLLTQITDSIDALLGAAGIAYWSTTSPEARREDAQVLDPSSLVISLRIGEQASGSNQNAPKRARITPGPDIGSDATYPAEHLLTLFKTHSHAVRDLPDLQQVAAAFSRWLLSLHEVPSVHLRHQGLPVGPVGTQRALQLGPALIRTHSGAALSQLLTAVGEDKLIEDPRILFMKASSKALALRELPAGHSAAERQALEREATALFFRVAATFAHRSYFKEKLDGVRTALDALRGADGSVEPVVLEETAPEYVFAAAEELYYHETLMTVFRRLGCPYAASRFALASTKHVAEALPDDSRREERIQRTGLLWSSVFSFCIECEEWEEAYAALLGNEVAEMQVDCVHQLVNIMVEKGQIASLCSLPFAHTSLVVHSGQPKWVSLLDEAVSALSKRAANSDVGALPQPYQVLFDFHAARGNFQSAAAAMLAYARRLAAEAPDDRNMAERAQQALAAAVGALALVEPEQAWLQDPGGKTRTITSPDGARYRPDSALMPPPIVTLADLRKEHAVAMAKTAVAGMIRGGDLGSISPVDVFHQLLALKLYDEALALSDAAFVGTKQQRMRERGVAALATTCAELQLQTGTAAAMGNGGAQDGDGDEGMLTEENEAAGGEDGRGGDPSTARGAAPNLSAAAAWKRLRKHLERYEESTEDSLAAGGYGLRVIAIDSILAAHPGIRPPLWLLEPFFPPKTDLSNQVVPSKAAGGTADVAGLLRAYLKHGRVEDAGALAVKYLAKYADSVPSVAFPRPASVYLPHALLEELVSRLPAALPVRRDLEASLDKVQAAAARQTQVLQDIYA